MKAKAIICGSGMRVPLTVGGLKEAIARADRSVDDPFVIIERSDEEYMQCLAKAGWQLEKRDGGKDRHFQASRPDVQGDTAEKQAFLLKVLERNERMLPLMDREDVQEAMIAYLMEENEPIWIIWTRIDV